MSNNKNKKDNLNKDENKGSFISLGLIYGASLGIILGMLFDKILIGIPLGAGLGLILGIIIDSGKK